MPLLRSLQSSVAEEEGPIDVSKEYYDCVPATGEGAQAPSLVKPNESFAHWLTSYNPLRAALAAEFLGTFLLVLLGLGGLNAATNAGASSGVLQVALVWGFALYISIVLCEEKSGAHLNPSLTLAFLLIRRHHAGVPGGLNVKVATLYIVCQYLGALCAGMCSYATWSHSVSLYEERNGIIRGEEGSQASAATLCGYFPNPGFASQLGDVSAAKALSVELLATSLLSFVVFSLTNPKVINLRMRTYIPKLLGLTLTLLVTIYAPLTGCILNPARDLGPRTVAYFAGWRSIAFPGPHNGFWVYFVGPSAGALVGGLLADRLLW